MELVTKGMTDYQVSICQFATHQALHLQSMNAKGGFHLLMLFMGAVGYILGGSGLKQIWSLIYAVVSIEKMLNRHAYAEH